ncbi:aspartate carbamoyltransferase regulatory subunit [Methanomicrobium antiquum]|uniref:Aspartate carbamoyltransferase regulatory chain n=1 Tax=Methanomicrobium antiquum TaxID=487686 RepID=A0AAF0FZQ1_9EURY|nr:aspartate carbamoyltransferase regulatory subunit [Methanomicrobium antiquum]MDD3976530.1 aspartate carbamoyltransferase regulatory subunit [Methanomicrobium sp.]WFN37474.1 aspartate carbamoyltransferase regulatory subunit [Methanomicrobium antiquum]
MKESKKRPENGLLISPIQNGTVIDHIKAGEALTVLKILGITGSTEESLSIATNVLSNTTGTKKDIVKISDRELSKGEVNKIALISPNATINIIRNYRVVEKVGVEIPDVLTGVVKCPNPGCITNSNEPIETKFEVVDETLHCLYCDNIITSDFVEYIV